MHTILRIGFSLQPLIVRAESLGGSMDKKLEERKLNITFGKAMKVARLAKGLSQEDVAEKRISGISLKEKQITIKSLISFTM